MSKELDTYKPYQDYAGVEGMPLGAPKFEEVDGKVLIHHGETKCRFELYGGALCGKEVALLGALKNHVKNTHGVEAAPSKHTGRQNARTLAPAHKFYKDMMDVHDQMVKNKGKEARQTVLEHVQNTFNKMSIPVYKSGNKLGFISPQAMKKAVRASGHDDPCAFCRRNGAKSCTYVEDECDSIELFKDDDWEVLEFHKDDL